MLRRFFGSLFRRSSEQFSVGTAYAQTLACDSPTFTLPQPITTDVMFPEWTGKWEAESELLSKKGVPICPVCKKAYANNHIFQCPEGHLRCEACSAASCKKCSKAVVMRKIRNRPLEHMAANTSILEITNVLRDIENPEQSPGNGGGESVGAVGGAENPHGNVLCKNVSCQRTLANLPIIGTRYRCLNCVNHDFCEDCVTAGNHAHHPLLVIPPILELIKDAIEVQEAARKPKSEAQLYRRATPPVGIHSLAARRLQSNSQPPPPKIPRRDTAQATSPVVNAFRNPNFTSSLVAHNSSAFRNPSQTPASSVPAQTSMFRNPGVVRHAPTAANGAGAGAVANQRNN